MAKHDIRLVLVCDGQAAFRSWSGLLAGLARVRIVAGLADARQTLPTCARSDADVVMVQVGAGHLHGAMSIIRRVHGDVAIMPAVIGFADTPTREAVLAALYSGAVGFVSRSDPLSLIGEALDAAAGGGALVSPSLLVQLLPCCRHMDDSTRTALTQRERKVITLLAGGLSNPEIASSLFSCDSTVRTHIERLHRKLGTRNRIELALVGLGLQLPSASELDASTQTSEPRALTVWLTGLPSAGKTTIGTELVTRLRSSGRAAELLDGDEARRFAGTLGFSRAERDSNVRMVGWAANLLSSHGTWAVCALVSPYREARDQVAELHGSRFVEAWVSAPLEVCAQRDIKGLYRAQREGSVHHLTGVDDPYEAPLEPEVVLPTHQLSVDACVERLWQAIGLVSDCLTQP